MVNGLHMPCQKLVKRSITKLSVEASEFAFPWSTICFICKTPSKINSWLVSNYPLATHSMTLDRYRILIINCAPFNPMLWGFVDQRFSAGCVAGHFISHGAYCNQEIPLPQPFIPKWICSICRVYIYIKTYTIEQRPPCVPCFPEIIL